MLCCWKKTNDLELGRMTWDQENTFQMYRMANRWIQMTQPYVLFFAVRGNYSNLWRIWIAAEQVIHEAHVQQIQRNIQIKHNFFYLWGHIMEWVLLCWAQGSANRIPMASTYVPRESSIQPPKPWKFDLLLSLHELGTHMYYMYKKRMAPTSKWLIFLLEWLNISILQKLVMILLEWLRIC
jgi:hypothetical protein